MKGVMSTMKLGAHVGIEAGVDNLEGAGGGAVSGFDLAKAGEEAGFIAEGGATMA